jgi:hypothetical protein
VIHDSGTPGDTLDDTITDNLTGLAWTRSADAGYDCGETPSNVETWSGAIAAAATCNAGTGFAGHDDWRLPNVWEMLSLLSLGQADQAFWLASQGFFGVELGDAYWTSTTFVKYEGHAWLVGLDEPHLDHIGKDGVFMFWLVRGGQ